MKTKASKLVIVVMICMPIYSAGAIDDIAAGAFAGRDIQIRGDSIVNYHGSAGEDVLVVERKFSLVAGTDTFAGDRAVIWLKRVGEGTGKRVSVWAYVSGKVSAGRGKGTRVPGLDWEVVEPGGAMVVRFEASGEVFVTAKAIETRDVRGLEFYAEAFEAVSKIDEGFAAAFSGVVPEPKVQPTPRPPVEPKPKLGRGPAVEEVRRLPEAFGFLERLLGPARKPKPGVEQARPQVRIRYPVNLAPAGDTEPNVEWGGLGREEEIATVIGRFYLWQKQDERGRLLELQADAAVVFYGNERHGDDEGLGGVQDVGAKGAIKAIYVCGDVVMTEGLRTIRADEMYYDFADKRGIAVNAVVRSFDVGRGIPIYLRAAKLRQLAEGRFAAENVVLTTSEFYLPQISIEASSILVTDSTAVDQQAGLVRDSSYDVQMRDICLKAGETPLLRWPFMRADLERPDVPFKSMRVGNDSIWGTSVESRWYLSRLLGLQEPEGTDGTFEVDYFSKRGVGAGIDVDYAQEDRFGHVIGYIIDDRGEDRLGRDDSRKDLKPPDELRGRFGWVHRVFMPYNCNNGHQLRIGRKFRRELLPKRVQHRPRPRDVHTPQKNRGQLGPVSPRQGPAQ
jgi:hypothetical protein